MTCAAFTSRHLAFCPSLSEPGSSLAQRCTAPPTLPTPGGLLKRHSPAQRHIRAAAAPLLANSSVEVPTKKHDHKGKKKKKKGGSSDDDGELEAKAELAPDPAGGLGSGPKGANEVEAAVEAVVEQVEEVVTNNGFEDKTLEAVRQALAHKRPLHREGSVQRVKGVTAAGNNREEKVVNAIAGFNELLAQKDLDNKCAAMASSPFQLYRGANHLFWADFSGDWRMARFGSPRTRTWLLGDMHIYNMGAFLNSLEEVCYGLNDFDESVIGDYQYDVWRLAISLVLTARQNSLPKVDEGVMKEAVLTFADAYLSSVVAYERTEGGRTFTKEKTSGLLKQFLKAVPKRGDTTREAMLEKMCQKDSAGTYVSFHYAKQDSKTPDKQKLQRCTEDERAAVTAAFTHQYVGSLMPDVRERVLKQKWPSDVVLDVAQRVNTGTGSLGMPRYYALLDQRANLHKEEGHLPIVLDVKLQGGGPRGRPTPFYFMDSNERDEYKAMFANEGERHLRACQALTDHTDPYLGYLELPGHKFFSVRERTPVKESYPALKEEAVKDFKGLLLDDRGTWLDMATSWGKILATLHAHAPHTFDAKMGRFHFRQEVDRLTRQFRSEFGEQLWQVAYGYALQVEADFLYFRASDLVPDDAKAAKVKGSGGD